MVILRKYGWILKDKKIRKLYMLFEIRKNILKCFMRSGNTSLLDRLYINKCFLYMPKNSALNRYRSFCVMSNNGRSIFKDFKMSRHFSKLYASQGHLVGMRKSSF